MRIDPLLTASPITGAIRPVTTGLLRDSYLAPAFRPVDLAGALAGRVAPWSASLAVAPEATLRGVETGLATVMRATATLDPEELQPERLPDGRARAHLAALRDLWREADPLPEALAAIRHVLGCSAADCLEPLPVVPAPEDSFADPVERALAAALVRHHGTAPTPTEPATQAAGALGHVQAHLGRAAAPVAPDDSLRLYGLRDPREEAEFAAALAQSLLDTGHVTDPRQVGLLVPDDPAYAAALTEAFDRAGLPLSCRPAISLRDPVGELLSAILAVLEGPAPRTALATIHASALMPWPVATGRRMAREIIENGWSRTAAQIAGPGREVLDALRPVSSPEQLMARLFALAAALPAVPLAPRIGALRAALGDAPDWPALHRLAAPLPLPGEAGPQMLEGVTLYDAASLPWRPVRQLIFLGLAGPHWPRPTGANPLFTEGEIALIRRETGLGLARRREHLARGLELFRRQLGAATEGATLLVPARGLDGKALAPSTGLALIGHLLGATEPQRLIRAPQDVPTTAIAPLPDGGTAGLPEDGILRLESDLLRIREKDEPVPQSPSRLEKLLYSPLGWALDELGAKDRTWAPETPDTLILGTLVGGVLELAFPAGAPVPDDAALAGTIPGVLVEAIARSAPWLAGPHWAVERAGLEREALTTALAWAQFLRDCGATVLGNEVALAGDHGGIVIAGRADTLLRLPDDRLLLIDHKRASGKRRRKRMGLGWDLQVALYRAMLERPQAGTGLGGAAPVIGYHNSLDSTVLLESTPARIPGAEVVADDISAHAMAQLAARLAEVGAGVIELNRTGDARRLDKDCGIRAYELEGNVLIAALLLQNPVEEEPADD